jgi:asparagine synthase (glutamine-hydrolysing)
MCGFVGASGALSIETLAAMTKKIAHRGPDNLSYESFDNIHLGHVRLSIIDLSQQSNQPLWDVQHKACIVFNGEIYNYQRLREELLDLGHRFNSQGDAEVILNLYLHYGPDCLKKLEGIFALVIWDAQQAELLVARDPFGVKPLYYTQNSAGFYFASELKALLLVPGVSRGLNYDSLFRTLVFLWSPGPDTVLKEIIKLEPGHYLRVKNHKIIQKTLFSAWPEYHPHNLKVKQICADIHAALQESIQVQFIADVPVGAFLSGGLDSSLIVAMAKKITGQVLECFTIQSNEADAGFVEDLPYAKAVADLLGVNLNIVESRPDIFKLFPQMIYHLDEPQADPACLNVALICKLARQRGIKVLFSGAGGDDVFTGYRRHYAARLERYGSFFPKYLLIFLQKCSERLPNSSPFFRRVIKLFAYAGLTENERLLAYFYWINPAVVFDLFTTEAKAQLSNDPMATMLTEMKNRPEHDRLERMLHLERRYFLVDHNFNYTDKMSMAHGVEVRVPFVDARVAEVASQIPTHLKQKGKQGKWVLKKMAERYLPKEIIYRQKTGFGVPLRHWLKGDLLPLVDDLLSEKSLLQRKLFKPETVHQLIAQDRSGKADYSYPIFALLCIEMWCRIFLDGEIVAPMS